MPLIKSSYKPPFHLRNSHLATIVPSTLRKVDGVRYERERIDTVDDDFLDLDWLRKPAQNSLIVLSHGLEGSSSRSYMKSMAKYFDKNGWDVLAWNCRSCGGEINRKGRFYHHGETEDLSFVMDHALSSKRYERVMLAGFSMGGSIILKYLGEGREKLHPEVKAAAVFSVPINLLGSVNELSKRKMAFYRNRFLNKLEEKVRLKAEKYPNEIEYHDFSKIKQFPDFDKLYQAPLHGFVDEYDFYHKASAELYLENIATPTLLVNALNDPFLPDECYPFDTARDHKYLYFETPKHGGHVGFSISGKDFTYMDLRALEFAGKN